MYCTLVYVAAMSNWLLNIWPARTAKSCCAWYPFVTADTSAYAPAFDVVELLICDRPTARPTEPREY